MRQMHAEFVALSYSKRGLIKRDIAQQRFGLPGQIENTNGIALLV